MNADHVEQEVGAFLAELQLPDEFQDTAVNALGELLGQENLDEHIKEVKGIIERLDFRWDMGFIQEDEYIQRREELKAQPAQLQPIPRDELVEARKLLKEFKPLWSEGSQEDRQRHNAIGFRPSVGQWGKHDCAFDSSKVLNMGARGVTRLDGRKYRTRRTAALPPATTKRKR